MNQAIHNGLQVDDLPKNHPTVLTRPHRFGTRPGIDWGRLNQLSDELEAAATEQKATKLSEA